MTTSQDQPPLSRRELRERARARAEEFDDSAEADRVSSGRRARAADGDGLVEVGNTGAIGTVTSDPSGDDARAATDATDPADASSSESTEADDSSTVVTESAIAKPFPFADQVEATSDDEGHTAFRLNDFTPEPAAAPAEEPSFDALFSDLLEPEADADDTASAKTGDTGQPDDTTGDDAGVSDSAVSDSAASDVPVGEPIDVHEPVAPVTPVELPQEERTLSRREWRAMRAAAAAAAAASESPDTETSVTETSDTATSVTETSDAAASASETSDSDEPKAPEAHEPQASDVEIVFQEPATDERDADQTGADQTGADQTGADQTDAGQSDADQADEREAERPAPQTTPSGSVFIPPLVEPTAAPHSALSDAMAEFEALTRATENEAAAKAPSDDDAPVDIERPAPAVAAPAAAAAAAPVAATPVAGEQSKPAVESTPFSFLVNPPASAQPAPSAAAADDADAYTPPIGHWSRQAELDDENQPFENTLSRDVGGGNVATTTNALVLPMIPQRDDFSSVLNATGEIMVTGTINLPGSVGTTGRDSRHYDDPEVDHLFDAFDNEIPNTDSAPVRAITAVSSHTATRGGIEPGRKQSNRMLNVLLVTASVMAVAVVGLLVAGFVFNIF